MPTPTYLPTSSILTDQSGGTPITPVVAGGTNSLPVALSAGTAVIGHVIIDSGTNTIGSVKITDGTTVPGVIASTTALKTDLSSVAGTATVTAASGVQKVGVVGNAGAIFDGATGASVPANALLRGARAATANPTAVTDGQMVAQMADKVGRQIVVQGAPRDLVGIQQTTIAGSSSETTIITAGAAGVFNDISSLVITMGTTPTACTATLKDATSGTTRAIYDLPATTGQGIVIPFTPPLPQAAAANNWTITLSSASPTVHINAVFIKNV